MQREMSRHSLKRSNEYSTKMLKDRSGTLDRNSRTNSNGQLHELLNDRPDVGLFIG